jgi:predicted transcriptional regulator
MTTREALHRLVDELTPRDLEAVRRFAEYLRVRSQHAAIRAAVAAPIDDEPETADETAAVSEALDDLKHGRVVPDDQLDL